MHHNDYEPAPYDRYRDDPDVQAYYYCNSEEAEEENRSLLESIRRAKEKLARDKAIGQSVDTDLNNKKDTAEMTSNELYQWLQNVDNLNGVSWERQSIGDDMAVIAISIDRWWKPIYLVDDRNKTAVQFMSMSETLLTVKCSDIDWTTVTPDIDGYRTALSLYGGFPTNVIDFSNNAGLVEWQINPDGRYFMDEDGYGMTCDVQVTLYGYIDRNGNVVEPFRYIQDNWDELKMMRERAERRINTK